MPLSGLKVLDLGIITAGAGVSSVLGDLGADVIKIESETYPDPFRKWAGSDDSPLFKFNNRNKRGLAIDLKTKQGNAAFFELLKNTDVVVENFRRGVMERLGIGFDKLKAVNPNIVLVSVTAQGLSGPGTENASFGSSLEARCGMASITGYEGDVPVVSGRNLNYPDQIVCLHGASAAVAAILGQQANPGAIHLDVSQRDIALYTLSEQIIGSSLTGIDQGLQGNQDNDFAVNDTFKTKDGQWLALSVTEDQLTPTLKDCENWLAQTNAAEAIEALTEQNIPYAISPNGEDVYKSDLTKISNAFSSSPCGDMVKGFAFQLKNSEMTIYRDSPELGQHNDEILSA